MAFDNTLPHALPWNYPWIKDEIERRDEYIAQLEAELAHSEPDSREKLEAEASELVADYAVSGEVCDPMYNGIIELLDRQAAITERNFRELEDDLTADNIWMHERIAELQSQLEVAQGVNERQDIDYIEQKQRIKELEHQRTVMAKKLMSAERDRDRYRAALGKAIDCADEIRRLS